MSFANFISVLFVWIWSSCVFNHTLGNSIIFPEELLESQKIDQYKDSYNTKIGKIERRNDSLSLIC